MKIVKKTVACCAAMILGLQGTGLQALANSPLSSIEQGLVAYVNMDENVREQTTGTNLVLKGGSTVTYEQGIRGKAMRFAGDASSATRLEFENRDDLKFVENEPFSIGLWVKNETPRNDYNIIGTKNWNGGDNLGYTLTMKNSLFNFVTRTTLPDQERFDLKNEFTFDNNWVYVVVSQNDRDESSMYINGEKKGSLDMSSGNNNETPAGNLSIGGDFAGGNGFGNEVAIDEVKVWNRTLSESEIKGEYTSSADVQIIGDDQVDLGDGQDHEITYNLTSFGGIDESATWAITSINGVSVEKKNAKQAVVKISKDVTLDSVQLIATYQGIQITKTIQILKDTVIEKASIKGTSIVVLDGEDTGIGYDVSFYNKSGTLISISDPSKVIWELKDAPVGVTLNASGQHADVNITKAVLDHTTIKVSASYEGISYEISTNIVHRGTIPDDIMARAEMYLDFNGNFEDRKGNAIITNNGEITYGEGRLNGEDEGAIFSKGHFIDLGKQNLKNKTITFSLKSNRFTGKQDPVIMGNKDWNSYNDNGFIFAYSWSEMKNRITGGTDNLHDEFISYETNSWKNVALVFASDEKTYRIYVDGMLLGEKDTASFATDWQNGDNVETSFKIGNDGTGAYSENASREGDYEFTMDNFMIINDVLSEEEVKMIDATYQGDKAIRVEAIGSKSIPEGSFYNMNLHINGSNVKDIKEVMFDIEYDKDVLEIQPDKSQMSVADTWLDTSPSDNRIRVRHMPVAREIKDVDFITYQQTRVVKLEFLVKDVSEKKDVKIRITNVRFFKERGDQQEVFNISGAGNEYTLSIQPHKAYDFNGDGVVGAGDIALAPYDQKEACANMAAIYPYKRAVMVTVDGAGNVWDPENAHYDTDPNLSKLGLDKARSNTYAMDLHNKEFATSYTAQSVMPAISAHNYSTMFTGVKWLDRSEEYRATNESGEIHYWPDYGKEKALYPTIFKTIHDQDPSRFISAMPEWDVIMDGLIEPDIGNYSFSTYNKTTFQMAADYMKENPKKFKQNAFMYLQSDEMDHYGHSKGYFTDGYYELLKTYDNHFKILVDELKAQEAYDDTLLISNSDHGGRVEYDENGNPDGGGHGIDVPFDRLIYMGVGGQTVNSGKRLEGGGSEDIPAIVLAGLRLDKPEQMKDSKVFDSSMFLTQEQMIQKGRDIEKITWNTMKNTNEVTINLDNAKSDVRVVDMVITNNANTIKDVETDGQILRQEVKGDATYLSIAFAKTPNVVAKLTFHQKVNEDTKIHEVMLGTVEGKEIYCDLQMNVKDEVKKHTIQYNLENVDIDNKMFEVMDNEEFKTVLKTRKDYNLPKSITILMDGVQISNGYTYDNTTGNVTIDKVTGDIIFTAKGVAIDDNIQDEYPQIKVEGDAGVEVIGKFPQDVSLMVKESSQEETMAIYDGIKDDVFKEKYKLEKVLDIDMLLMGEVYTIKNSVEVRIKLSEELQEGKKLNIVYINDKNEISFISSVIDKDSISFFTDHFSRYAIVSEKDKLPVLPVPGLPQEKPDEQTPLNRIPFHTSQNKNVKTGDTKNTGFYMGLFLMTAGFVIYGVEKKRKQLSK